MAHMLREDVERIHRQAILRPSGPDAMVKPPQHVWNVLARAYVITQAVHGVDDRVARWDGHRGAWMVREVRVAVAFTRANSQLIELQVVVHEREGCSENCVVPNCMENILV